jgi:DNA-binding NtrC family response regulator
VNETWTAVSQEESGMKQNLDPTCRVRVLSVSPLECDQIALAHIFGHTAWELQIARSLREASEKLFRPQLGSGSLVILCDESLPDGSWKELLHMTQDMPQPHNLIVTSHCPDDRLWAEVLNCGAYDVLQRPFRAQEVFRTVGLAWTDGRKMSVVSLPDPRIGASAVA